MAEGDDDDEQNVILDAVDDPVVTDAHSQRGPALQRASGGGTWVLREERNCALDAATNRRIELPERTYRGGSQLDSVLAHSQPRSAFTCSQGMFGPSSLIAASNAATSSLSSRAAMSSS